MDIIHSNWLTVVIKIEQDRQQYCEGYRNKDISNIDIPEVNEPASI